MIVVVHLIGNTIIICYVIFAWKCEIYLSVTFKKFYIVYEETFVNGNCEINYLCLMNTLIEREGKQTSSFITCRKANKILQLTVEDIDRVEDMLC